MKRKKRKSFNLIQISEERKREKEMRDYEILDNLYEILENRINSDESKNSFNKKFLEIDRNEFDDIRIKINEEYQIIELDIMIDSIRNSLDIMILDSEESKEDDIKYDILYSIRLDYYYDNFRELKNLIHMMINDFLDINYQIRI